MTGDDVLAWRPVVLVDGARAVEALAARLDALAVAVLRARRALVVGPGAWHGPAASRAAAQLARRASAIQALRDALAVVRDALLRAGARIGDAQEEARHAAIVADVALVSGALGPAAGGAAALLVGRLVGPGDGDEARAAAASCAAAALEATDRCRAVARAAAAERGQVGTTGYAAVGSLALAASPDAVASWWSRLPPSMRADAARPRSASTPSPPFPHSPSALTRVGLPASVRDVANRGALAERVVARRSGITRLGPGAADAALARSLSALAQLRDPVGVGRVPARLLVDEPAAFGGRGAAAVSIGDPDHAAHVVYLVPGLGSTVADDMRSLVDEASRLYLTARTLTGRHGAGVAVVAWLGYRSPGTAQVAFERDAVLGGRLLADEVEGLRASRGSRQPHVTLVGHSYGSLVAATGAGDRPGAVDDLVALGSPGLGAARAFDVPVPFGHVWVGAASGDPVSRLSWFGPDPAGRSFGARRFHAESRPGSSPLAQHAGYLAAGSLSLVAVARIAVGGGGSLPTAAGRTDHGYVGAAGRLALPPPFRDLAGGLVDPRTFADPEAGQPWSAP